MPPENLKYMALLREPRKKPSYFPLYWLIGILIMLYYNLNNQGFCIAQVVISHRCLLLRPKMFPPQKSPSSVTKKLVHSEVKHSLHGKLGTTFPLSCSPVLLGFMTHFQLNPLPTERTPRPKPIGSMYGICTYISLKFMVNLGKYSIRGGKTGIKKNYPIPSMGLIYLLTWIVDCCSKYTLNSSPLKIGLNAPKGNNHILTIHFQVRSLVSGRVYQRENCVTLGMVP